MNKTAKRVLSLVLAVLMTASMFTCVFGLNIFADTADQEPVAGYSFKVSEYTSADDFTNDFLKKSTIIQPASTENETPTNAEAKVEYVSEVNGLSANAVKLSSTHTAYHGAITFPTSDAKYPVKSASGKFYMTPSHGFWSRTSANYLILGYNNATDTKNYNGVGISIIYDEAVGTRVLKRDMTGNLPYDTTTGRFKDYNYATGSGGQSQQYNMGANIIGTLNNSELSDYFSTYQYTAEDQWVSYDVSWVYNEKTSKYTATVTYHFNMGGKAFDYTVSGGSYDVPEFGFVGCNDTLNAMYISDTAVKYDLSSYYAAKAQTFVTEQDLYKNYFADGKLLTTESIIENINNRKTAAAVMADVEAMRNNIAAIDNEDYLSAIKAIETASDALLKALEIRCNIFLKSEFVYDSIAEKYLTIPVVLSNKQENYIVGGYVDGLVPDSYEISIKYRSWYTNVYNRTYGQADGDNNILTSCDRWVTNYNVKDAYENGIIYKVSSKGDGEKFYTISFQGNKTYIDGEWINSDQGIEKFAIGTYDNLDESGKAVNAQYGIFTQKMDIVESNDAYYFTNFEVTDTLGNVNKSSSKLQLAKPSKTDPQYDFAVGALASAVANNNFKLTYNLTQEDADEFETYFNNNYNFGTKYVPSDMTKMAEMINTYNALPQKAYAKLKSDINGTMLGMKSSYEALANGADFVYDFENKNSVNDFKATSRVTDTEDPYYDELAETNEYSADAAANEPTGGKGFWGIHSDEENGNNSLWLRKSFDVKGADGAAVNMIATSNDNQRKPSILYTLKDEISPIKKATFKLWMPSGSPWGAYKKFTGIALDYTDEYKWSAYYVGGAGNVGVYHRQSVTNAYTDNATFTPVSNEGVTTGTFQDIENQDVEKTIPFGGKWIRYNYNANAETASKYTAQGFETVSQWLDCTLEWNSEKGYYQLTLAGNDQYGNYSARTYEFTSAKKLLTNLGFVTSNATTKAIDDLSVYTFKDFEKATIEPIANVIYNNQAQEPALSVKYNGVELTKDVDYTVEYTENINAGTATATLTGIGNYAGVKTATFTIEPKDITNEYVISPIEDQKYTGQEITPEITVEGLTSDDYDVQYSYNTDKGENTALVKVIGKGNFKGEITARFSIVCNHDVEDWTEIVAPKCTEKGKAEGICKICSEKVEKELGALGHDWSEWDEKTYPATCTEDGKKIRHCLRDDCDAKEEDPIIHEGHKWATEYTVDSEPDCKAKTDGQKSIHCTKCDAIDDTSVTVVPWEHKYVQNVVAPTCELGGYTEYTCSECGDHYIDELSRTEALGHKFGNWTVAVKPTYAANGKDVRVCSECKKAEYRDTAMLKKTAINKQKVKISVAKATYNGKSLKPSVKLTVNGKAVSTKYFTISYSKNKNPGKATVKLTAKGGNVPYTGSVSATFIILPKKGAVSGAKSTSKGKLSVTVKKDTKASGYQIQYADNSKFKKAKTVTIKNAKTYKATIKKLKSKKTYYVRTRSYVVSTKYVGSWSSVKKAKIK